MAKRERLSISKTKGEWLAVDRQLSNMGRRGIKTYVAGEISKLCKRYKECDLCVTPADGYKIEARFYCNAEELKTLQEIAHKMQRPVASVVCDFIIAPLLIPRP